MKAVVPVRSGKLEFLRRWNVLNRWFSVWLLLGAGAVLAMYWVYGHHQQMERTRVELRTVAQAKMQRLQDWVKEKREVVVSQVRVLEIPGALSAWANGSQSSDSAPVIRELAAMRAVGNYVDLQLWDPETGAEMSLSGAGLDAAELQAGWAILGASVEPRVADFFQTADHKILIPILIRVSLPERPLMLVVFVGPTEIIFPILGDWTHQTLSGECLLVGMLEDQVRVISPLRNAEAARLDLGQKELTSVMAVDGVSGVVEGRDYRGSQVMAYVGKIPDTPWWLVAKKDRDEIVAEIHGGVRVVAGLLAVLLIFFSVLMEALLWREERLGFAARLTETKKAEQRFRDAILGAPIPTMITAEDGEVIEVNAVWLKLSGYARASFSTLDEWIERAFPHHLDEYKRYCEGVFKRESTGDPIECELLTSDGKTRHWICRSAVTGALPDGRKVATLFATDVTERRLAEAESRDTLEMVNATFMQTRAGLMCFRPDGQAMVVNPAAIEIWGGTLAEMQESNFNDYESWRNSGMLAAAKEVLATNNTVEVDEEVETRFGKRVALVGSFSTIKWKDERWLFFSFNDEMKARQSAVELAELLRKQKLSNASLASEVAMHKRTIAQHRLLQRALEAVPSGVIITDPRAIIEWVNPAVCEMTGYDLDELIGESTKKLKSGRHDAAFYRGMWEKITNGESWTGTVQNRRKDDTFYWESMVIAPVLSDSRSITHFVAIKRDITAQRQMEEQFHRSQRMESIGMLAGGLSHDLNNVLSPIMMGLELFKMRSTNPAEIARLEMLLKSTERGAGIVRQMLSFARGVDGERAPLSPVRLLKEVSSFLNETIPPAIELTIEVSDTIGTVLADITQMHQVMINLAVNARDAMPDGGLLELSANEVAIKTMKATRSGLDLQKGAYILFRVRDSGTGIPEEILDRIFDPFFTTKPRGRGTGLGLSSVHGIIRGHEGAIDVITEPGKGTEFCVYVPMCDQSDTPSVFPQFGEIIEGKGRKVLLVDDEDAVRMVVAMTLEECGFDVEQAGDGRIAQEMFNRTPDAYAVVILDFLMPLANGAEVAQVIKERRPNLPIVLSSGVLSGGSDSDKAFATYRRLGDRVMKKPFSASRLIAMMQDVLGESEQSGKG